MYDHSNLVITANQPILDALTVINNGNYQIALVLDSQKRLLGTVTDGDVRRGLLNGKTLTDKVELVMNKDFSFITSGDDIPQSQIFDLMRRKMLMQMPVLDELGRVEALLFLKDELSLSRYSNPVVIMAGGKGTRLHPYTENCPKPMLTVGGQPMLETLLNKFIACGFYDFYFSVNYLKEQIIDYFKDGSGWGVKITYLEEANPLGTAGSLSLLPSKVSKPILVINGDIMTHLNPVQLLRFHCEHQAYATLCVRNYSFEVPFGVVKTESDGVDLLSFEEKPSYDQLVNTGIYVIDPMILSLLTPNEFTDMPSLLQSAKQSGYRVAVCPMHEYWLDVGNPNSLKAARLKCEVD